MHKWSDNDSFFAYNELRNSSTVFRINLHNYRLFDQYFLNRVRHLKKPDPLIAIRFLKVQIPLEADSLHFRAKDFDEKVQQSLGQRGEIEY